MHVSSFKKSHLLAKDSLKLNNTINTFFDKAKHYFILFFVIKYL